MNFSGKFVYYYSHPDPQTPSFHFIATPLIMIVAMRGNVSHSTNQAVNQVASSPAINQVDWRLLGQQVVSKWVHSFLDKLVWWSRTPFQFTDSFINFVLHFHLHQHYSNITTVRNLLKLWFFFYKNLMQQHNVWTDSVYANSESPPINERKKGK